MSNAPNESHEEMMASHERDRATQRGYAGKKVAYLCGALRFLGVKKVMVAFDAYGDEGSIKEAVCEPPIQAELPFGLLEEMNFWWISFRTTGWGWNFSPNAYLDGTLVLDVATGEVVEVFDPPDADSGDEME